MTVALCSPRPLWCRQAATTPTTAPVCLRTANQSFRTPKLRHWTHKITSATTSANRPPASHSLKTTFLVSTTTSHGQSNQTTTNSDSWATQVILKGLTLTGATSTTGCNFSNQLLSTKTRSRKSLNFGIPNPQPRMLRSLRNRNRAATKVTADSSQYSLLTCN